MSHNNTVRLDAGQRVRNWTQQYDTAISNGTAIIVEVIKQHQIDDTWEYRVLTDTGEYLEWNMVDVPTHVL